MRRGGVLALTETGASWNICSTTMAPWAVPEHMRKPRQAPDPARAPSAALAPVWVEADEVQAFKTWWDQLPAGERNARRAFLQGLQRADAAWGSVYRQLGDELQRSRESLRTAIRSSPATVRPTKGFGENSTRRSIARTRRKSA